MPLTFREIVFRFILTMLVKAAELLEHGALRWNSLS
jgi:hypothetical protein